MIGGADGDRTQVVSYYILFPHFAHDGGVG